MIPITAFSGLRLNLDPTELPDDSAQHCVDVDFSRSIVEGLRESMVRGPEMPFEVRGMFVYSDTAGNDRVFVWPNRVSAVQSPVAQDDHKRFYWTGNPGTGNQFRFAKISENSGYAVTSSYKVGVINSSLWDNKTEALGITFDTVPAGPSVAFSDIESSSIALWLCDKGGALLNDVTEVVSSIATQGDVVNGWARTYRLSLTTKLEDFAKKIVSSVTYEKRSMTITYGGSVGGTPVEAEAWYLNGVLKYITTPQAHPEVTSDIGTQVEIFRRYETTQENGIGGTSAVYAFESLGKLYLKSTSTLSVDNSTVPADLSVRQPGDTTLPEGYSFAVVWKLKYAGQPHTVSFYVDKSLGGALDIGTGVSGALAKVSDLVYDINLTFGSQLGFETRSYLFTFVNQLGEESETSLPVEITLRPGSENVRIKIDMVTFASKFGAAAIGTGHYALHGIRTYRSVGGEYFYVGTMKPDDVATMSGENYLSFTTVGNTRYFIDDVTGAALGDACSTIDYVSDAEELQKLQGLCSVYNGILAAFKDNEVWLCEPYMPWAWKRTNVITLPYKVVALMPLEQGLLVLTELKNYYMGGQQPSDFVPTALEGHFPCMNQHAAVSFNGGILYLSTDGPVIVQGATQRLDQSVVTRDGWRWLLNGVRSVGGEICLANYGSRILMYWGVGLATQAGTTAGGAVFDADTQKWTYTSELPVFARHVPANSFGFTSDMLAFTKSGSKYLWQFAGHDSQTKLWQWHSKDFTSPLPLSFGAFQLYGAGTVRVQVYADGQLVSQQDVEVSDLGGIKRLPSGFRGVRWSFKFTALSSGAKLRRAYIVISPQELKSVI